MGEETNRVLSNGEQPHGSGNATLNSEVTFSSKSFVTTDGNTLCHNPEDHNQCDSKGFSDSVFQKGGDEERLINHVVMKKIRLT